MRNINIGDPEFKMPLARSPSRSPQGDVGSGDNTAANNRRDSSMHQEANNAQGNSQSEIASSSTIHKFPPFWPKNPRVWFLQIESIFSIARISSDETKFRYLIANIDANTLDLVSDILESAPVGDKYSTLKSRIISLFSESDEKKLKRLLSGQVLGDQQPSIFLRTMQNLGRNQVGDNVIRSLFLEQLPENVRSILAISDQTDVTKLAEQADKIMDIARPAVVSTISSPKNDTIAELSKQIESLQRQFEGFGRGRNQQRSISRKRSKSRDHNPTYCWYHQRFGNKARKCNSPCTYQKN